MKKSILHTALAASAAVVAGLAAGPSTLQLVQTAADQAGISQRQEYRSTQRLANQTQAQQQAKLQVKTGMNYNLIPYFPGEKNLSNFEMSPKEYGEWLMRTGKNKYNNRCHKHWAKA